MADSTPILPQMAAAADDREIVFNGVVDALSPASLYGRDYTTCTGLVFGYCGGRFSSSSIADGTVTATASNTNYVVAALSNGAVSISTATTNWNDSTNYVRLYLLVAGGSTITSYEDHRQSIGASTGGGGSVERELQFACSDLTTAIATGLVASFRAPRAMTVTGVKASLDTPQTSGSVFTIDIKEAGTTILSTLLTFDNTEETTTTAATPAVVSDAAIANDAKITVHVTQVGDSTAKGLVGTIVYT